MVSLELHNNGSLRILTTDFFVSLWMVHTPKIFCFSMDYLMQPSMGTLNSPSSRIVKDDILRYINFGIGESYPISFLDIVNLHLMISKAASMVNVERTCVLLFYYFLCLKANLDLEITNLDLEITNLHPNNKSSPNFIFAVVNPDPIILEKR